jgi:hypothetical protein
LRTTGSIRRINEKAIRDDLKGVFRGFGDDGERTRKLETASRGPMLLFKKISRGTESDSLYRKLIFIK